MLERALAGLVVLSIASPCVASAQCRTRCTRTERRDPYGCCIEPAPRTIPERPGRAASPSRPETLVGEWNSVIAADPNTELFHWARAWLASARGAESTDRGRAVGYFRWAAGASLVFLTVAPDDPRAGRMRAVLVQALDGAGMSDVADLEAASLGGPRPSPEPSDAQFLRADTLRNLAWGHLSLGQRIDRRIPAVRPQAIARLRRAADYYRLYVQQFPTAPDLPSARTRLASALLGAGAFLEAAAEFEAFARANPERRLEGTLRSLECYERALALEIDEGRISLPMEPPPPSQRPPWAEVAPFPDALSRLFNARDRFLESEIAPQEPAFTRAQELENALWLYRYARFEEAEPRLMRLLTESCDDGLATEAFNALTQIRSQPGEPNPATACEAARQIRCSGTATEPRCVPAE